MTLSLFTNSHPRAAFFLLLILLSCTQAPIGDYFPDDFQGIVTDAEYFYGNGQVSKDTTREVYVAQARVMAMADISSQISADVKVEMKRHFKEIDKITGTTSEYELERSFSSINEVRTEMTLENAERTKEVEDKDFFFAEYRLSKTLYEEEINRRVTRATTRALNSYVEGIGALDNNPIKSLEYFFRAMRDILPFMDHTLLVNDPQDDKAKIPLGTETIRMIHKIIDSVSLEPEIEKISGTVLKPIEMPATAIVTHNNKPLADAPIKFWFEVGNGTLVNQSRTTPDGRANSTISKIRDKQPVQLIAAELDIEQFTGDDELGKVLLELTKGLLLPRATFQLDVRSPIFSLNASEMSLGEVVSNPLVTQSIMNIMEERIGATFTNEKSDADYSLSMRINTTEFSEAKGYYKALVEMSFSVEEDGRIIFSKNYNNISATDFSYADASTAALRKAAKEIRESIGEEIISSLLQ